MSDRVILWIMICMFLFMCFATGKSVYDEGKAERQLDACLERAATKTDNQPNFTPACPPAPDCPVDHKAAMREAAICWNALERIEKTCWWGQAK